MAAGVLGDERADQLHLLLAEQPPAVAHRLRRYDPRPPRWASRGAASAPRGGSMAGTAGSPQVPDRRREHKRSDTRSARCSSAIWLRHAAVQPPPLRQNPRSAYPVSRDHLEVGRPRVPLLVALKPPPHRDRGQRDWRECLFHGNQVVGSEVVVVDGLRRNHRFPRPRADLKARAAPGALIGVWTSADRTASTSAACSPTRPTPPLLRAYVPAAFPRPLRWSTLTWIPGRFVSSDWHDSESDLLFSIEQEPTAQEPEPPPLLLYVLPEHRSSPDRWMPLRVLTTVPRSGCGGGDAPERGRVAADRAAGTFGACRIRQVPR